MIRLKEFMAATGLTQTGLAARIGVTQPTVWEWLNGDTLPCGKNLRRLSEETGLSIDDLLSSSSGRLQTKRKAG